MTEPLERSLRDAPRLSLKTLGAAALRVAGEPELLLGPGKPLALLIFMALTPGRRISREFLVDLLWADLEPERARNALRQALFHLRRLLGEDALPGNEELTLTRPVDVDRDHFLGAIERGELRESVDLYSGEFLPAFGVPGGAAFEHWADLERDRLRSAFLRCSELLVRRDLNQSRFRDAQRLARRARDEIPRSEAAWRLVLEAAVTGRDFLTAAVEAEALEQWATLEEHTLEPATRQAVARARQVTQKPDDTHAAEVLVAELTGREREFSLITTAWESARLGSSRHLHLTAPAGLGKTRLLREIVARLRAAGALVVDVRGTPADRDVPFAFAGDLALGIAALPGAAGAGPASASALIALNPALSSFLNAQPDESVGEEALRRRIHALVDLVHAVADEQPFALIVDDAHWIDAQSYRSLEGLCARLGGSHVLCVTASRPERLPSGDAVSVVPLLPLTAAHVASLVSGLAVIPRDAAWSSEFVTGLHDATRGSPLLILETLRLALDEEVLALNGGEWRCLDESRLTSLLRAGAALRERVRSLPREHGWILALLGTAGTPVTVELLAKAVENGSEVPAILEALERLGLAVRSSDGWSAAHDEIAAAAREALSHSQRQTAEHIVGDMMVDAHRSDAKALLRGVRHYAAAGDDALVRQSYRRYALLARQRGDRRSFASLAAELLADDADGQRVAALVASLPTLWRIGLWSGTRRRAAVATAVLLLLASTAAVWSRLATEAALPRIFYADSARGVRSASVQLRQFDGRNTSVVVERQHSPNAAAALGYTNYQPAVSPDGRSVAWNEESADSTTIDIWIRTPSGTRRLTNQARDDLATGWLPDGSGLVGMTNRWSSPLTGNYDIAVFDTATGAARQVTGGPEHDGTPSVSPEGGRIAFVREPVEGPPLVCVVAFDGKGAVDCRLPGGFPVSQVLGWSTPDEVLVTADSALARPLIRYDWRRNQHAIVFGPHVYNARLSPDRRWVLAAVRFDGIRGFRDWVIPLERPGNARRVELDEVVGAVRWWEGVSDTSDVIARIEFTDSASSVLPGIRTRLGIRAESSSGIEIPVRSVIRWSSSDTLVATVDSMGDVFPRTTGTVRIEASLSGWRTVARQLEVGGAAASVLLDEKWDGQWKGRWIAFGDPQPIVVSGPGGIASLWNHGDGTYPSFALLRDSLPARDGLGMEVRLSTPLTRANWQHVRTWLIPDIDTALFAQADQKKATPLPVRIGQMCGAGYPNESGEYGRGRMALYGGTTHVMSLGAVSDTMRTGTWWTLRLQILPDGRCGIAINNRVIWLAPEPIPLDRGFRVYLGDESADGRLLHGPVKIWTGVRTDLDWSRVPR